MTHLQLLLDLLLQIINLPHERALRIIYKDYDSSFSQHFEVSNESTIPIKNVEVLMTGIHKFLDDLSPRIINDIFQKSENYFLKFSYLVSKRKFITTYGTASILSLSKILKFGKMFSRHQKLYSLNPLQPGVAFLYRLKTSGNLKVF